MMFGEGESGPCFSNQKEAKSKALSGREGEAHNAGFTVA